MSDIVSVREEKTKHIVKVENDKPKSVVKAALIGNPNCGKTTLFNQLTGSNQYVGNWPGVTVEHKAGRVRNWKTPIDVIDLPGIYSFSPYSPEEVITRNYLEQEKPDIVINIIDATNIERNLYLTTQLLELDYKVIIALNMMDILMKKGKKLDYKKLEKEIGVKIIPISASKALGINELLEEISKENNRLRGKKNFYSDNIEASIKKIEKVLSYKRNNIDNLRFKAIKVFEKDALILSELKLSSGEEVAINEIRNEIKTTKNRDYEIIIADERYKYICKICSECIMWDKEDDKESISDKIDRIFTGKFTAIPMFLVMMFAIFFITFGPIGNFLKQAVENFMANNVLASAEYYLNMFSASDWTKSLVLDAIIGGTGAVLSFLPQVILLFTLLSILEDSGYMARAAFVMDKLLRKIGLSGKAFVPLLMGFGCSVPAVLGTRILENKKDKNLTIFLIPFMSCSAKMPLYFLFASAFFPNNQTIAIFSLYLLGIVGAIFSAFLFKDTLFKGQESPFVMELPTYKLPSRKNLLLHIWDRVRDFLERAGTVILGATIIIWFLQSFNLHLQFTMDKSESILAVFGSIIAPIFTLCGFGNWQSAVSLLTGLIAKESIVSTLCVLYNAQGTAELGNIILNLFSPMSAYAFMVFVLLYTPCVAAVSAIHKELKSWKLTIISIIYQLFIAWFASALVYQFGTLFSKIFI